MRRPHDLTPAALGLALDGLLTVQSWWLVQSKEPESAADDVCAVLQGADVSYSRVAAVRPELLVSVPGEAKACVVTGASNWDDASYAQLDVLRTRIRDAWAILIWIATPDAAGRLSTLAPNFWSFLTEDTGTWSHGGMSPAEVEERLGVLRARYGLSDAEVIALAARGELPHDADHHLWLILLERGGLI